MFRRFRFLVGLFAIVVVTAIAGGSAYFYFGGSKKDDATIENKVETSEDGNNISADNILENYEFGADKNLNETYTYYFFPSTLYMELYDKGYTNPEKVFGYNEVVLDDSGDPVLTSVGQPTYEINQSGIDGVNGYKTYYDYLVKSLNGNSSYYLYSNGMTLGDYTHYISTNSQTFTFGDGLDGDDYYVNGPSFSINNIYELNNKGAKFLIDTLDINNYSIQGTNHDTWNNVNYTFKVNNEIPFNKENEVLSPIYGDNPDFSIDLRLNDSTKQIYDIYYNFYSNTTNVPISKNSISGTLKYIDYGDYRDHTINTNNHSLFYVKNNNPHLSEDFGVYDFNTYFNNRFVGTWNIDDNTKLVILEADQNGNGNGMLTYLEEKRWGDDKRHFDTFQYQLSNNRLTLTFTGTNGANISGTINLNNSAFDPFLSPINGRAQYRNDRFGFWTSFYDWDDPNNSSQARPQNTASRYLPIKITVNGNLTPDDMAKVIPSVSASTFDDHYWFDYTSNVWTYTKANTTTEYTTAVGGFTAKDITNIFDIMQNPSKYAENNVIRLYPVFSNGKNSGSHDPTNGGSDGIKAEFKYKEGATPTINNSLLPDQTKLTYAGGSGNSYTYGVNYNLNYAILKNVELVKDRYESIVFRASTTASPGLWGENWTEIYRLNGDAINDFVNRYGAGLYSIYLFIGGRATDENQGSVPFGGTNTSIIELVTKDSEAGNDLKDKHLMSIYDNDESMFVGTGNDGFKYIEGGDNIGPQTRPVGLTIEKVTNFRLVTDIPIREDGDGKPSNNQDWGAIDESVHQGLLHAENFIMADSVYELNLKQFNKEDLTLGEITGNDRLDSDNPYIYVIQNADFRFVNNLYFQIRFSNDYIKDALEVRTNFNKEDVPDGTPQYVACEINNQLIKFQFQSGDEIFIDNVGPVGSGDTARSGFKLRDYNARGIYDILLVSTKDTSGISSKHTLNMYINRHTNSFIKLFEGNPGTFEYKDPEVIDSTFGTEFVRHKLPSKGDTADDGQSRDPSSTLLWNGHTYLGEYLATNTSGTAYIRNGEEDVEQENGNLTFIQAVKNCLGITPGNDLIYPIIDAVTGKAIAYYNSGVGRIFTDSGSTGGGDNSSIDLFNIMKNYVLYIDDPINPVA